MTSANLLNLPHNLIYVIASVSEAIQAICGLLRRPCLLAMTVMIFSTSAYAQYSPPPMFDDMGSNSARPEPHSGYIVPPMESSPPARPLKQPAKPPVIEPRVSRDPEKYPQPEYKPYIPQAPGGMTPIIEQPKAPAKKVIRTPAPPVIPAKKPSVPVAPAPAIPEPKQGAMDLPPDSEMTEPIISRVPVYSPEVIPETPKPAPAKTPVPRAPNAPRPAAKVTSPGVVKGPKTMPAVPTTNVDQVETFDDSALQNEPTIMERHIKATTKKQEKKEATLTPVVPPVKPSENKSLVADMPSDPAPLIAFDDNKPTVMKKILPYQAGQIDMAKTDMEAIAQGVQDQLNSKPDWRIQIRSFATPQGEGLSSDRRIALSRALSIRTALVGAGIDPSVIDMRAEGLQSDDSQTGDRVDLYLYNPAQPVQTP